MVGTWSGTLSRPQTQPLGPACRWPRVFPPLFLLSICVAYNELAFSRSIEPRASSAYRKQRSLVLSRPVPIEQPEFSATLSRQERMLLSRLSEAGKKGQWTNVKQMFGKYAGCSVPVYNAAMQAAYRCGQYKEGGRIFNSLRGLPNMIPTPVTLHLAVKVFGKLRLREEVDRIWNETKQKGWVDEIRAAGRIDAAAEMGDIVCAAEVLDYMHRKDLNIDINHFHSAMNACKNAEPPSPSAAMYLYKQLLEKGFEPTASTMSILMGAHNHAPLSKILSIRSLLSDAGLQPDTYFADSYLVALLEGRRLPRNAKELAAIVHDLDASRLQEVRRALKEFQQENNNVMTPLCIRVAAALRKSKPSC